MNRNELFINLEQSLLIIGKEIYKTQVSISNLSPGQNHVLMLVASNEPIGIKKLSKELYATSSAATQHVDALEKNDLLIRRMNPNDRREVVVETTKKGLLLSQKLNDCKSKGLRELFKELTDDELSVMAGLFNKISKKYLTDEEKHKV